MEVKEMQERHYNHKWEGSRKSFKICQRCGCQKVIHGFTPEYTLNGVTTFNAPSCIKPERKKYPPKYGKAPRKPKGYNLNQSSQ